MDVTQQIEGGIWTLINVIKNIANPLAVLAVVIIGIYLVWAGSQGSNSKSVTAARAWLICIIIGLVLINLAKPIVDWLQTIGAQ